MDLRDSDGDGPDPDTAEVPRTDPPTPDELLDIPDAPEPAESPEAFVEAVAEQLETDPDAAGDAVGELLRIARDEADATRVAAGEALDAIGRRNPRAFEVWSGTLADAAADADDEVAFLAMRALAQLAAVRPRAAHRGLRAAIGNLGAPHAGLRGASLSVVAEVGPEAPDAVESADRPIAAALSAEDATVRVAAAIAAGRLLEASPNGFPRTATALVEAVEDAEDRVREYVLLALANFADAHPENVPEKQRVIKALANADEDELGLRRGALGEALSALVALTFEGDGTPN